MFETRPDRDAPPTYQRFSQANTAFNALSRDLGESWYPRFRRQRLALIGKNHAAIRKPLHTPSEALRQYAQGIGLGALEFLLQPYLGVGSERSLDLWQNDALPQEVVEKRPTDAAQLTEDVRRVALLSGAGLVGVAPVDARWIYREIVGHDHSSEAPQMRPVRIGNESGAADAERELVIPQAMDRVIVVVIPMQPEMIRSAPSLLAEAATSQGYAEASRCVLSLAHFIHAMGYGALPCLNDTALSVPMAVDAGLGEVGRNGLLITPQYGSCVRLAKVLTDMPLVVDQPREFGLKAYCATCDECARACPAQAISYGPPTTRGHNECNNDGIRKWYADGKKCLRYWVSSGTSCGVCQGRCPFTLGAKWWGGLPQRLIARTPRFNRAIQWLDRRWAARKRLSPELLLERWGR